MHTVLPSLSIQDLARVGALHGPTASAWLFRWPAPGMAVAKLACLIRRDPCGIPHSLSLKYRDTNADDPYFYAVGLRTARNPGRAAYAFRCPVMLGNTPCLRETTRLTALSVRNPVFGCDACYRLIHRTDFAHAAHTAGLRGWTSAHVAVASPALPAIRCPTCASRIAPDNFCSFCGTSLLREPKIDPYQTLELDRNAALSPSHLKSAYRQKLKQYHPDRVAFAGPKIRELANEETRRITQAYRALQAALRQAGAGR